MEITEVWKDIDNYQGFYQVSNLGRVKRTAKNKANYKKYYKPTIKKEKILKPCYDGYGYESYTLCLNSTFANKRAHVLVACAFLKHIPNGLKIVVDHIDGNPLNNNLKNLQLISHRENISKSKKGNSKYTGVCWHKTHKKWIASIYINKVSHYLGYFENEDKAYEAYKKKLNETKNL